MGREDRRKRERREQQQPKMTGRKGDLASEIATLEQRQLTTQSERQAYLQELFERGALVPLIQSDLKIGGISVRFEKLTDADGLPVKVSFAQAAGLCEIVSY